MIEGLEVLRVGVNGQRDFTGDKAIDKQQTVNISDLKYDGLKSVSIQNDIVWYLDDVYRKFYENTDENYNEFLAKYKLTKNDFNEILKTKQGFRDNVLEFISRFHSAVGDNKLDFNTTLAEKSNKSILGTGFIKLENVEYDLSNFDEETFLKIAKEYKESYDSSAYFAFMHTDNLNKKIIVTTPNKSLYYDEEGKQFYTAVEAREGGKVKIAVDADSILKGYYKLNDKENIYLSTSLRDYRLANDGDSIEVKIYEDKTFKKVAKTEMMSVNDINPIENGRKRLNNNCLTQTQTLSKIISNNLLDTQEVIFQPGMYQPVFNSQLLTSEISEKEETARAILLETKNIKNKESSQHRDGSLTPGSAKGIVKEKENTRVINEPVNLSELAKLDAQTNNKVDNTQLDAVKEFLKENPSEDEEIQGTYEEYVIAIDRENIKNLNSANDLVEVELFENNKYVASDKIAFSKLNINLPGVEKEITENNQEFNSQLTVPKEFYQKLVNDKTLLNFAVIELKKHTPQFVNFFKTRGESDEDLAAFNDIFAKFNEFIRKTNHLNDIVIPSFDYEVIKELTPEQFKKEIEDITSDLSTLIKKASNNEPYPFTANETVAKDESKKEEPAVEEKPTELKKADVAKEAEPKAEKKDTTPTNQAPAVDEPKEKEPAAVETKKEEINEVDIYESIEISLENDNFETVITEYKKIDPTLNLSELAKAFPQITDPAIMNELEKIAANETVAKDESKKEEPAVEEKPTELKKADVAKEAEPKAEKKDTTPTNQVPAVDEPKEKEPEIKKDDTAKESTQKVDTKKPLASEVALKNKHHDEMEAWFLRKQNLLTEAKELTHKAVESFKQNIQKGSSVKVALDQIQQEYKNPDIVDAVEKSITTEFQLMYLKDESINTLRDSLAQSHNAEKELENVIVKKEEAISQLNKEKDTLVSSHEKDLTELHGVVEKILQEKAELEEQVETLNDTLVESSNVIEDLQVKVKQEQEYNLEFRAKEAGYKERIKTLEETVKLKEQLAFDYKDQNKLLRANVEDLQKELARVQGHVKGLEERNNLLAKELETFKELGKETRTAYRIEEQNSNIEKAKVFQATKLFYDKPLTKEEVKSTFNNEIDKDPLSLETARLALFLEPVDIYELRDKMGEINAEKWQGIEKDFDNLHKLGLLEAKGGKYTIAPGQNTILFRNYDKSIEQIKEQKDILSMYEKRNETKNENTSKDEIKKTNKPKNRV